jgi:hypothetical protein
LNLGKRLNVRSGARKVHRRTLAGLTWRWKECHRSGETILHPLPSLAVVWSGIHSHKSKLWSQLCFRDGNAYTSPSRCRDLPQFLMRSAFLVVIVVVCFRGKERQAADSISLVNGLVSVLNLLCLVVEDIWLSILLTCDQLRQLCEDPVYSVATFTAVFLRMSYCFRTVSMSSCFATLNIVYRLKYGAILEVVAKNRLSIGLLQLKRAMDCRLLIPPRVGEATVRSA